MCLIQQNAIVHATGVRSIRIVTGFMVMHSGFFTVCLVLPTIDSYLQQMNYMHKHVVLKCIYNPTL